MVINVDEWRADEPVEFEKLPVQAQDFRGGKPTVLEEYYGIFLELMQENRKMSTCKQCICLTKVLQVFHFWHARTHTQKKDAC